MQKNVNLHGKCFIESKDVLCTGHANNSHGPVHRKWMTALALREVVTMITKALTKI